MAWYTLYKIKADFQEAQETLLLFPSEKGKHWICEVHTYDVVYNFWQVYCIETDTNEVQTQCRKWKTAFNNKAF